MSRTRYVLVTACWLLLAMAWIAPASAAKRVALVIGNSAYKTLQALPNPRNDAELMAKTLRRLDFEVITAFDASRTGIGRAIRSFGKALGAGGKDTVGLFYFAGHGVQARGRNYLIPIGADIQTEDDLQLEAITAATVLARMETAGNALNLVILDACRNNPFKGRFRSVSRGLTRIRATRGSLIAYSAGPGEVAADGGGAHSPYTSALVEAMQVPGLAVEQMFKRVRIAVEKQTGGAQTPWEESSLRGEFYFVPGTGAPPATPQSTGELAALQARLKLLEDRIRRQSEQPKDEPKVAVGVYPRQPKAGRQYKPGDEFRDCDTCPKMVVVPAGSFMMGSPASEPKRDKDEGPRHKVRIPKPFAVGKFEVTFAEWDACVADGSCSGYQPDDRIWGRGGRGRRPVINVSWYDAKAYVAWLSRKTGKTYRLLSESEWEYAARAGTTTPFSTGQRITTDQANFDGGYTYNGSRKGRYRGNTVSVGTFGKNAFGLYDMHGNVWEWVEDCYVDTYGNTPADGSARTHGGCSVHVLRGGSWNFIPWNLRSADRNRNWSDDRNYNNGFRLARTLWITGLRWGLRRIREDYGGLR